MEKVGGGAFGVGSTLFYQFKKLKKSGRVQNLEKNRFEKAFTTTLEVERFPLCPVKPAGNND
jgi:hypothetical protein